MTPIPEQQLNQMTQMDSISEPLSLRTRRIGAESHLLHLVYLWSKHPPHLR